MTYVPRGKQVCLSSFTDIKTRNLQLEQHGNFNKLADAQALDAVPTDLVVAAGIGKLVVVINAATDSAGSITVTGTSVNRETGIETGGDTDTLTVSGLTTDSSTTDANGVIVHGFANAYITAKWFTGTVTLSTTDLTCTDVDVWLCAFEQLNDTPTFTIDTLDVTAECTNTAGWFSAHLYTLTVTGDTCVIADVAPAVLTAANSIVGIYRLRRGNLATKVYGTSDGFWLDIDPGPDANTYWSNINTKVWCIVGGHF